MLCGSCVIFNLLNALELYHTCLYNFMGDLPTNGIHVHMAGQKVHTYI